MVGQSNKQTSFILGYSRLEVLQIHQAAQQMVAPKVKHFDPQFCWT